MFKIGDFVFENKVVVAPMAGVSNIAFRSMAKEFGAGLIYSEMVSDKALTFNNEKTMKMIRVTEEERPLVMQIFGSDVKSMIEGARILDKKSNCDIIDINLGCPVTKIVKSGAGSRLLQDPEKVFNIVKSVVEAVDKPVTVKIRIGWNHQSINDVEIAQLCERAGARAIAVHGRTRSQLYSGSADWSRIKAVKDAVKIPVIGNGDITTPEDAKRMIDETGCDAIMIGRATLGNPWLIKQTVDYLNTGTYQQEITIDEKIDYIIDHMNRLIELKGPKLAILEMRSHAAWYVKGMKGATKVKREVSQIQDKVSLVKVLEDYRKYLKEDV